MSVAATTYLSTREAADRLGVDPADAARRFVFDVHVGAADDADPPAGAAPAAGDGAGLSTSMTVRELWGGRAGGAAAWLTLPQ